jgi:type II secretion system protein G
VQLSHTFWQVISGMILGIFIALLYANRARFQHHDPHHDSHTIDIFGKIKTELDRYEIDSGVYPKSFQDLLQRPAGMTNWHGPYFYEKIPQDPWGNNFIYEFPGKHNPGSYDLMSVGPDGKKGTDDDIGNW